MKGPLSAVRVLLAALPLVLLLLAGSVSAASPATSGELSYCKCNCFGNSTTIPLYLPTDPAHPCLSCTKQFCLNQNLAICKGASIGNGDLDTGTGKEGSDVEALCFKRASPRDHILITLFLLTTSVLLACALAKRHLAQRGVTAGEVWEKVGGVLPWAGAGGTWAGARGGRPAGRQDGPGYERVSSSVLS